MKRKIMKRINNRKKNKYNLHILEKELRKYFIRKKNLFQNKKFKNLYKMLKKIIDLT